MHLTFSKEERTRREKERWSGSIWANGRRLWIRNSWVLITGFTTGLISNLGQVTVFLPELLKLWNMKYSWTPQTQLASFCFWVFQPFLANEAAMGPLKAPLRRWSEWATLAEGPRVRLSVLTPLLWQTQDSSGPYSSPGLHPPLSSSQPHKYNDCKYDSYKMWYKATISYELFSFSCPRS